MAVRPALLRLGCVLVLTGTSGCLLPEYQMPQGFSSSYHRYLFQAQPSAVGHAAPVFESGPSVPFPHVQPPEPPTEPEP